MSRTVRGAAIGAAIAFAHTLLNALLLRRAPRGTSHRGEAISVLIPARDEEACIGDCLRAVLASTGVDIQVLVLDDGSTDATADVVRRTAASDARVRLLAGAPLPRGWLGKPHACAQLAAAATGSVLVFVDADVVVEPDGIAGTAALLRSAGMDLISPYPRQLADGLGPRLVQPLLQWSWLTFLPLRIAERLPIATLTAANGQLLACDADAYRRAGGHTAVRSDVIEDVALARAFKRAGARVAMADGTAAATCRMYGSWRDLRDGYTKSLWAAFGSRGGATAVLAMLCWLYVLPPVAALVGLARGRHGLSGAGLLGYSAAVAGRIAAAARTGGRVGDAAAHPLSIVVLAALTARSWRERRAGRLVWKGRTLAGRVGG